MVAAVEDGKPGLDIALWSLAVAIVSGAITAHYYFAQHSLLARVAGLVLAGVLALGVSSRTRVGRRAWSFWTESVNEVRKVMWPTRKETMQSTMAVLVMVFVMGLVLWTVDSILLRIIAKLIGPVGV